MKPDKELSYSRTLHLCSNGHDEVCFHGGDCPVCHEKDRSKDELRGIGFLESRVSTLELEIKEIRSGKKEMPKWKIVESQNTLK